MPVNQLVPCGKLARSYVDAGAAMRAYTGGEQKSRRTARGRPIRSVGEQGAGRHHRHADGLACGAADTTRIFDKVDRRDGIEPSIFLDVGIVPDIVAYVAKSEYQRFYPLAGDIVDFDSSGELNGARLRV